MGDEIWDGEEFDSKEEAIKAAKKFIAEDKRPEFFSDFEVGQIAEVIPCGVDVDSIIENVAENTTCEYGEVGDDYLCNVTKEDRDELEEKLNDVLFAWMKEHNYEPDFFMIENEETVSL
jgi:hypothetical protein